MKNRRVVRTFLALTMAFMIAIAGSIVTCAATQDNITSVEEMNADWVPVTIIIDGSGGYPDRLTVYLDSVPIHISGADFVDGMLETERYVSPGVHRVNVISKSDITDIYGYSHPDTFNTSDDTRLAILVTASSGREEVMDTMETPISDFEEAEAPEIPEYDFSEGDDFSTVNVACKYNAAIRSLTYSLMGEDIYDIVLDRDNSFMATVRLPAGSYKELALADIQMDEDVLATDIRYSLAHSGNRMLYGAVYDLAAGEATDIDDLQVMMNVNGSVMEVDSGALFAAKQIQNYSDAAESRMEEKKTSLDIATDPDDEPETIAVAIPEEIEKDVPTDASGVLKIILLISVPALLLTLMAVAIRKIKKWND